MSASFEAAFAAALLDPRQRVPDGVTAPGGADPSRRFGVYRNNVVAGLVKALESRFPAVVAIVGEAFFVAMARAFIVARPPRAPLLAAFGDEFAGFIAAFEPARDVAYLADVARLEAARTRAYNAADAIPVDASRFAALDPAAVGAVRVALHPSAEIICSPHPIVTIWTMNTGAVVPAPIPDWRGEDALVVRPYRDVEVRALPPGGAVFLSALAAGQPLGAAADRAMVQTPDFDLAAALAGLIGWGLVRDITVPASTADERD